MSEIEFTLERLCILDKIFFSFGFPNLIINDFRSKLKIFCRNYLMRIHLPDRLLHTNSPLNVLWKRCQ